MSLYDAFTSRTDAVGDVSVQDASEIINGTEKKSVALSLGHVVKTNKLITLIPVLTTQPAGYFVSGDTGLKSTSKAAWTDQSVTAAEIAVIVPIAQNVLDDSNFDIFATVKPKVAEAFAKVIDDAILFGTGAPGVWPTYSVVSDATAAGNTVEESGTDVVADALGAAEKVSVQGYSPNGIAWAPGLQYSAAQQHSQQLVANPAGASQGFPLQLAGLPVMTDSVSWDGTQAKQIVGDFSKIVIGMRQDISFEVFTSGVITDNTGAIVTNLLQQDSVALRVVMRLGWTLAKPVNSYGLSTRSPFALVTPAS